MVNTAPPNGVASGSSNGGHNRQDEVHSPPVAPAVPVVDHHASRRRYEIDVRIFLAVITAAMAVSFGVGVSFGPTDYDMYIPSEIPSLPEEEEPAMPIRNRRRKETEHTVEIGEWDDVDVLGHPLSSDEEEHLPQGQHLLVDIKNVDADFLNSESRLAQAMVDVVENSGLHMLSYHCHALFPAGVSCVGVLLESHISLHTWPEEGVIALDLFTCGDSPLLPVVQHIERLFGIPRPGVQALDPLAPKNMSMIDGDAPFAIWSHELRGFRTPQVYKQNYLDSVSDLAFYVTSPLQVVVKNHVLTRQTRYQRIDIWDINEDSALPNYVTGMKHGLAPDDPRWASRELVEPNRVLFLDGTLQSLESTESTYHEALVHPVMFAHPNPKRVAIVGGGEGAPLREVLKHSTVDEVVMIELDAEIVEVSRQYLPQWNDCSDFTDVDTCFDEKRVSMIYEDGREWFLQRRDLHKQFPEKKWDVIIMDALDPEDDDEISQKLYTDDTFLSSIFEALTDDGVLVVQVGTAPSILDPRADKGVYANREVLFRLLEEHSLVQSMMVYEESHCGFAEPHSFLVVCRSSTCRKRWYANSDKIDYEVTQRTLPTKSGEPTLAHFDGSTQFLYRHPPKAWETVYCRRDPVPYECAFRYLDPSKKVFEYSPLDESKSSFRVDTGKDGEPRVFALQDIPEGSFIMPSHLAASLVLSDNAINNLEEVMELVPSADVVKEFVEYVDDFGHASLMEGIGKNLVEIGGTVLMRTSEDKANVRRWVGRHPSGKIPVYSPVYQRHYHSFDVFMVASRKIKKGEELLKFQEW